MATRYFKATFSNGVTLKRSTASRAYTHAWLGGYGSGFSSSAELAAKAAAGYQHWNPESHREVVAVEEITAKEFRNK